MDFKYIRKSAKAIFGSIDEEVKAAKNIYFFKGKLGAGYMYNIADYPELLEITSRRTLIGKEAWGIVLDPVCFIKMIWLKPEIIDNLKVNVNSIKEFRNISKAEYRRMSLDNAEEAIKKADPKFLERHPRKE